MGLISKFCHILVVRPQTNVHNNKIRMIALIHGEFGYHTKPK
jgi:hypothetical protein